MRSEDKSEIVDTTRSHLANEDCDKQVGGSEIRAYGHLGDAKVPKRAEHFRV